MKENKLRSTGFAECFHCMGTGTAEDEFGREGECAYCGGIGEVAIRSIFFEPYEAIPKEEK